MHPKGVGPAVPLLPFLPISSTSLSGVSGAGRGRGGRLRRAWGVLVRSPLWPNRGAWPCTRESGPQDGADPSLRTFVRPAPSGCSAAPGGSPVVLEQVPDGTGTSPGVQVWALRPLWKPWSPAESAARLVLAPGLTDVRKERFPLAAAGC